MEPRRDERIGPFGPTSLDLLIDRLQGRVPTLVRAADGVLVAGAAVLALADVLVWATDPEVPTGRLSVSLAVLVPVLGAAAVVAVALRPRRPVGALATLSTASVVLTAAVWAVDSSIPPSFAALFALAIVTTRVLRREPGRPAVVLAAAAAGAVAAEAVRPHVGDAAYLLVVCEGAFALAVGAGVYLRWSDWRRAAAAAAARTDERLEIARELHDVVGHHVTGMVVQAQAARHVSRNRAAAAEGALEMIEVAGTEALAAMHQMVGTLRDASTQAPGTTWADVDGLIDGARRRGDPVRATIDPEARRVGATLAPSVHRIITESLTNVRRHGHEVGRIDVAVRHHAGRLVVTVEDDGAPPGPAGPDTYGIVGMRERVTALGGCLDAGPASGRGWVVRAELPVEGHR